MVIHHNEKCSMVHKCKLIIWVINMCIILKYRLSICKRNMYDLYLNSKYKMNICNRTCYDPYFKCKMNICRSTL